MFPFIDIIGYGYPRPEASSSRSSSSSNTSEGMSRSWSFFSLFRIAPREAEKPKEITAKEIKEIILPLLDAEADLRKYSQLSTEKKGHEDAVEKANKASDVYTKLKPKAIELYGRCKKLGSPLNQKSLLLIAQLDKLNKILDNNPKLLAILSNPSIELSESDIEDLYAVYCMIDTPFVKDYLNDNLQYKTILDQMGFSKNKSALQQLRNLPASRLKSIFKDRIVEIARSEVEKIAASLPNSPSAESMLQFEKLVSSPLMSLLLLNFTSLPQDKAYRKISDHLKKYIQDNLKSVGNDHAKKYQQFKHFLAKTFALENLAELESKENDYSLIKLYAKICGKPNEIAAIEKELIDLVSPKTILTIQQRFDLTSYESTSEISLTAHRNKKVKLEESTREPIFDLYYERFSKRHQKHEDINAIQIDKSKPAETNSLEEIQVKILDHVNLDTSRGKEANKSMIVRVDGKSFLNTNKVADAIYAYLINERNFSAETALRYMSVLQQSGTIPSNDVIKQLFQKEGIIIAHNSNEFDPIEMDLDTTGETPVLHILSRHKVIEKHEKGNEVIATVTLVTRIQETQVEHFLEIQ